MYIKIYRKIWATIRHDLWVSIQEEKKKENTEHLSPEKFSKLYSEVHSTFETVRMEIYSMMMNETVERHEARELMQKAYITFATLSATSDNKSRWADQVNEAAMQHGKYIEEFEKNIFYPTISEDPRDTIESDEKISLAGYAGYSKQKTLAPKGVKQNEARMSEEAEVMVKKVCELVMSRVMSNRHKKVNAHAQVEVMMHKVEDYEQKHHQSPEEEHHCSKPTL